MTDLVHKMLQSAALNSLVLLFRYCLTTIQAYSLSRPTLLNFKTKRCRKARGALPFVGGYQVPVSRPPFFYADPKPNDPPFFYSVHTQ